MERPAFIKTLILFALAAAFYGCIGTDIVDDFVEPRISILNKISAMLIEDSYQFEAAYFNQTGVRQPTTFNWVSSHPEILEIDENGMARALAKGDATIMVSANQVNQTFEVVVHDPAEVDADSIRMMQQQDQNEERTAVLRTVSSYQLEGTATLKLDNGPKLLLSNDFETTDALPGLYLYLTNNTSSIANALEVGAVTEFSGQQQYELPLNVRLYDYSHVLFYCKPFRVPVGEGEFMP